MQIPVLNALGSFLLFITLWSMHMKTFDEYAHAQIHGVPVQKVTTETGGYIERRTAVQTVTLSIVCIMCVVSAWRTRLQQDVVDYGTVIVTTVWVVNIAYVAYIASIPNIFDSVETLRQSARRYTTALLTTVLSAWAITAIVGSAFMTKKDVYDSLCILGMYPHVYPMLLFMHIGLVGFHFMLWMYVDDTPCATTRHMIVKTRRWTAGIGCMLMGTNALRGFLQLYLGRSFFPYRIDMQVMCLALFAMMVNVAWQDVNSYEGQEPLLLKLLATPIYGRAVRQTTNDRL